MLDKDVTDVTAMVTDAKMDVSDGVTDGVTDVTDVTAVTASGRLVRRLQLSTRFPARKLTVADLRTEADADTTIVSSSAADTAAGTDTGGWGCSGGGGPSFSDMGFSGPSEAVFVALL
mmetsp:Transcript_21575/g.48289  ORF Transcript_21575/g.48289 Transcript_21575/m.48289 type:complete len:118 (-) Transcript_21575:174-527(-)